MERALTASPRSADPAPPPLPTIRAVSAPEPSPAEDPNRTYAGARQRLGPFWIEEPAWFWAVAIAVFLVGLGLFVLAVFSDLP